MSISPEKSKIKMIIIIIERNESLLLINQKKYNFREKKYS